MTRKQRFIPETGFLTYTLFFYPSPQSEILANPPCTAAMDFTNDQYVFEDWVRLIEVFNKSLLTIKRFDSHVEYDDPQMTIQVMRVTRDLFYHNLPNIMKNIESAEEWEQCCEILEDRLLAWIDQNHGIHQDMASVNLNIPLHR